MTSGSALSGAPLASAAAAPSLGCGPMIKANLPTLRRSLATIRSAVASPIPGNVESCLTSCSSIVRAISRTGRTIARSAFRTPTPSTEQKISKNSRSIGRQKPDHPGNEPAHHRPPFNIEDGVERDRLAQLGLNCSPGVLADQDFDLERLDQERGDLVRDRLQSAANSREHESNRPFTSA